MGLQEFSRRTRLLAPAAVVFDWHATPGALERLTPPWERVEVLEHTGGIRDGVRVVLAVHVGPFRFRWILEHRDYHEGHSFRDVQVSGPFRSWEHTHLVEPDGPAACYLEDRIRYAVPCGSLAAPFVRRRLERTFAYRHRITAQLVQEVE
jgi:ligand-binding SRPBCC domain-containing protein